MTKEDFRDVWANLGEADPMWAVLSKDIYKNQKWEALEFFETGVSNVHQMRRTIEKHGYSFGRSVLDFGCGVGRLTQALALSAEQVVGVDVAQSMINKANSFNRHPKSVRYVRTDGFLLPFEENSFDSAVSLIVLQHAPPPAQIMTLVELHRVVRPGGVVLLQAPNASRGLQPLQREACIAKITLLESPAMLRPSSTGLVRALVKNIGNATWPVDEEIKLGNHWRMDGVLIVGDDARADLPHRVCPGESVELSLLVRAPEIAGSYELELDMVQELVAWWADLGSTSASSNIRVTDDAGTDQVKSELTEDVYSRTFEETEGIEMHPLSMTLVQALFHHLGSRVISAETDDFAGPEWDSRTYLVEVGDKR